MLYNNDIKKVESLDKLLYESGFRKERASRRVSDGTFFKPFEKDYLLHVISSERLDGVISKVHKALDIGDMESLEDHISINNFPVSYKGNLVYGIGKYLHWFRGYYYQVSGTPDGQCTVQSPYFWMRDFLNIVFDTTRFVGRYTHVEEFVLSMSAMSTALFYYDKTMALLSTPQGISEFDAFLAENYNQHHPCAASFDTKKVLDCFSAYECANIPSDVLITNAVLLGNDYNGRTCAILSLRDDGITVVTRKFKGYLVSNFRFPDWYVDSDGVYENKFGRNPYRETKAAIECFVQFALMYSGVRVLSTGFFFMRKDADLKESIMVNIPVIYNAGQLADFIEGKQ